MTATVPTRTVPGWPLDPGGSPLTWGATLAWATREATADPAAGWRSAAAALGAALTARLPAADAGPLAGRPVTTGLWAVPAADGVAWPLDTDPDPAGAVVLARRTESGDLAELAWYAAADVDLRDTAPAPGTRVWGGTEARPEGARPLAVLPAPAADRSDPVDPDAAAALLAGAHALGVAAHFRDAFVAKARVTNRGWYALRMIEDPTVLKALLAADGGTDAAAALLREHAARGDAVRSAGTELPAALQAAAEAAGIHALDTALRGVTELLGLTGASALYDGNPMQRAVLHLGALGQHPTFTRDSRVRTARRTAGADGPAPSQEPA